MPSSNKQFYQEPPKTSNIRDILSGFYPQDIEEAIDAMRKILPPNAKYLGYSPDAYILSSRPVHDKYILPSKTS